MKSPSASITASRWPWKWEPAHLIVSGEYWNVWKIIFFSSPLWLQVIISDTFNSTPAIKWVWRPHIMRKIVKKLSSDHFWVQNVVGTRMTFLRQILQNQTLAIQLSDFLQKSLLKISNHQLVPSCLNSP